MPRKTKEADENLVKALASDTVKSTTKAKKSDSTKTVSKKDSTKKANSKDSASKEASIKSKLEKTTKSKSSKADTTKKSTEPKKAVTKRLSSNEIDNTKKSASTKSTKNTTTKMGSTKGISSDEIASTKKVTSSKKSSTNSRISSKDNAKKDTKKTTSSKSTAKKNVESKDSKTKPTSTKKTTTKSSSTSTSAKKSSTKSSSTAKATAAKSNSKTTSSKKKNIKTSEDSLISVLEYYDLPYRYNETVVKILAQTPNILFVYWDISDVDRSNFKLYYGDNFFEVTRPVLIVHNETMNYSFEIEINDFANSWYLHVNDANCKYNLELGRRPLQYISNIQEPYIYVSSSNKLDAPNNHILFEKFNPSVTYKNVKNNSTFKKDFSNMVSFANIKKIYGIYDLYKQIYKDELFNEITNSEIANPSSGSSSSFK